MIEPSHVLLWLTFWVSGEKFFWEFVQVNMGVCVKVASLTQSIGRHGINAISCHKVLSIQNLRSCYSSLLVCLLVCLEILALYQK